VSSRSTGGHIATAIGITVAAGVMEATEGVSTGVADTAITAIAAIAVMAITATAVDRRFHIKLRGGAFS